MNKNTITLIAALLASTLSVQASIILNVDFSNAGATNLQASDSFQNFNAAIASNTASQSFTPTTSGFTSGSITVGLGMTAASSANGALLQSRDRSYTLYPSPASGNMSGAYKDVYRDFYRLNSAASYNAGGVGGGAGGLVLTLSGLNPNQEYSFAWQSFDANANSSGLGTYNIRGFLITGTTSGATFQDANATTNVDPSSSISVYGANSASALFPSVTSDASGVLSFRFAVDVINGGTLQTAFINSFELAAVPEPSTYALFGGLAVVLVAFLRRRK
ncbi:MAG: PEP-CTERM sorting domain-containing protein [Verrucomicrobiota bacterium]|nr:PEP-CTERM sorting domain-containing protein [Verrucomicrobiota bacterium]